MEEEIYNKYGKVELQFNGYYKNEFHFKGILDKDKIQVTVHVDIHNEYLDIKPIETIESLQPSFIYIVLPNNKVLTI